MSDDHISDLPAPCPECGGDGGWEEAGSGRRSDCRFCDGTGSVESEAAVGMRDLDERCGDGPGYSNCDMCGEPRDERDHSGCEKAYIEAVSHGCYP